ncbi:MAG: nuclear transport factor 2 family protein [Spirosomataceae bacterium]
MKKLFFLLLLLANVAFAQKQEITPELLAQKQLEAYNAHDIDAFVEPYADDVEIYRFPDKLLYKGKETMRKDYGEFFKNTPKLHCELKNRIIQGNTVIDKEYITGTGKPFEAVAVYQIENNKIKKVYFIQ